MKYKSTISAIFTVILFFSLMLPAHALESVSYLFAGNTQTYIRNVERTGASLKTVCPDYFEINANGTLKTTIKYDRLFVESMHAKKLKVTPYLSNNWDRALGRAMLANMYKFAADIAKKIKDIGADGLNVDIQNLTEVDRHAFTEFISALRTALPSPYMLTVCVAPNPWSTLKGWQGSYDYHALGSICDQMFLMAYDDHYQGGTAGAVAGYPFVERSIKTALKDVPTSKLVLGIPFYGRYWKEGASSGGNALTISDIDRFTQMCESQVWYDEANECARAKLTVTDENLSVWGANKLTAGTYDIWYEDERSLDKKLSLVSKYKLAGAGSWALGQEPSHLWNKYYSMLLGHPLNDIEGNWSESYVLNLYERGVLMGTPDGSFQPEASLSRAQAAVMLVRAAGLADEPVQTADNFADTADHWAAKEIAIAHRHGIFKGYPGNLFRPEQDITREEFAVICDRILFNPDTMDYSEQLYTDVDAITHAWSVKSIVNLTVNGIFHGYEDGTFNPEAVITRGETAKVLKLTLEQPGGLAIGPNAVRETPYVLPR